LVLFLFTLLYLFWESNLHISCTESFYINLVFYYIFSISLSPISKFIINFAVYIVPFHIFLFFLLQVQFMITTTTHTKLNSKVQSGKQAQQLFNFVDQKNQQHNNSKFIYFIYNCYWKEQKIKLTEQHNKNHCSLRKNSLIIMPNFKIIPTKCINLKKCYWRRETHKKLLLHPTTFLFTIFDNHD